MAYLVSPDGEQKLVTPQNGEYFEQSELRALFNGRIKRRTATVGTGSVLVYEIYALNSKPKNDWASRLAGRPLHGDVLICEKGEIQC